METKKIVALVCAGALVGAAAGVAGSFVSTQDTIKSLEAELAMEKAKAPQVVEVVETVTEVVEVPVNVTEYVEVDNGNLSMVLDHVYEMDGDVEYLLDDLDDDEVDMIVDRIVFANETKALAVAEVKAELFDELDGEEVNGTELDEDDMERLRIDDDADEVVILEIDFEELDAEVMVTGTFEQDDVKYSYEAVVEIKDGEVEDFKRIEVSEE